MKFWLVYTDVIQYVYRVRVGRKIGIAGGRHFYVVFLGPASELIQLLCVLRMGGENV